MAAPLHVVLHEPEIPNNTGNIGRTCVATGAGLHIIKPMAFETSVKALRRAGLDYWPRLAPSEHESFDDYLEATGASAGNIWLFTTRAHCPVWEAPIHPGDHLVFGKETSGLPDAILDRYPHRRVCFPMVEGERSLNLATSVCAALYEGIRQCCERGQYGVCPKGTVKLG